MPPALSRTNLSIGMFAAVSAVAETGSLIAAARRLGISPATLKERINALEDRLSVKLIGRSGRNIYLTDVAHGILPIIKDILIKIDDIGNFTSPKFGGSLKFGVISTYLHYHMIDSIVKISNALPDIELTVTPGTSDVLFDKLINEEIDCAIVVRPPFPLTKDFLWIELRNEEMFFIHHKDDIFSNIKSSIQSNNFIRINKDSWTGIIISNYLNNRELHAREIFELDAFDTIVSLVERRVGVSIIHNYDTRKFSSKEINIINIKDKNYHRSIGILSKISSKKNSLIRSVINIIMDASETPDNYRKF